jgi:Polyketide cyclase / dehydrase and lipid transport
MSVERHVVGRHWPAVTVQRDGSPGNAQMTLGSIRHQVRIRRPAADVWELAGDAARLAEWFPGITACQVDGTRRVITLGSGMAMPEEILVVDAVQRRFQYRITAPLFTFHRGTIDVIHLDESSCLVVYSTDADPRTMALTIGGATAGALDELKRQMESSS